MEGAAASKSKTVQRQFMPPLRVYARDAFAFQSGVAAASSPAACARAIVAAHADVGEAVASTYKRQFGPRFRKCDLRAWRMIGKEFNREKRWCSPFYGSVLSDTGVCAVDVDGRPTRIRLNNIGPLPHACHLFSITSLLQLELPNCNLSAIPDIIRVLSQLRLLDLSYNGISTLPCSMSQLRHLLHLELSYNLFGIAGTGTESAAAAAAATAAAATTDAGVDVADKVTLARRDMESARLAPIMALPRLQELNLAANLLVAMPATPPTLKALLLNNNSIVFLPETLPATLVFLDLSTTFIKDIPETWCDGVGGGSGEDGDEGDVDGDEGGDEDDEDEGEGDGAEECKSASAASAGAVRRGSSDADEDEWFPATDSEEKDTHALRVLFLNRNEHLPLRALANLPNSIRHLSILDGEPLTQHDISHLWGMPRLRSLCATTRLAEERFEGWVHVMRLTQDRCRHLKTLTLKDHTVVTRDMNKALKRQLPNLTVTLGGNARGARRRL